MKRFGLMAAAVVAMVFSAPAQSASITYSGEANVASGAGATRGRLTQFSPTLGTLQSVLININYLVQAGFSAYSLTEDGAPTEFSDIYFSADSLGSASFDSLTVPIALTPITPLPLRFSGYLDSLVELGGQTNLLAPSQSIASFVGDGTVEVNSGFVPVSFSIVPLNPSASYGISNRDIGTFTFYDVTYFYSAVPEPTSWALMIAGVGLVGSGLRKRRSRYTIKFAHS